uniref:Gamma interferon inducible lysosomal thiol reductase n=1 Tax=Haemonchus contortus TaxID=6289 RepID=A0A7I5E7A9_HAECO|nr:Gamma interferon inducible lysosomal thiol reductase GILT domain containing protein [Haemonchus contortus]
MVFVVSFFLLYMSSSSLATVVIDIVGESMCSDTTRFLETQLLSVYRKYQPYVKINYHPFGPTARTSCSMSRNGMRCKCHHGPEECRKNALQACLLQHYPDDALETVTCVQGDSNFQDAFFECIEGKFSWKDKKRLYKCATTSTGFTFVAIHGATIAREISDHITWVPWISIKGQRIVEAEYNLEKVLCKKYLRVPQCNNYN